jgi:hypothetical protein
MANKPFNPPSGPAAQANNSSRPTLAQSMWNTMPPITPGGKVDPNMLPLTTGVTKEIEPHYRKLKEEEERLRDELRAKQEKLRNNVFSWEKVERETKSWTFRSELSEKAMRTLAEGPTGAF